MCGILHPLAEGEGFFAASLVIDSQLIAKSVAGGVKHRSYKGAFLWLVLYHIEEP